MTDDLQTDKETQMEGRMHSAGNASMRTRWSWLLILAVVAFSDGAQALQDAQDKPPPSSTQQVDTPADPLQESSPTATALNPDLIQANLKQIQAATDLSEEAKTKAADLLNQSLQQLEIAAQWTAKAAEFENARVTAPEALQTIQAELSKPAVETAPEAPAARTGTAPPLPNPPS